jgi:hypothetical protein
LQGVDHDNYYAAVGRNGDGMPPYGGSWQEFSTVGYNVASDEFTVIIIDCTLCEQTVNPTGYPTFLPSSIPTLSNICSENYVVFKGCCDDDFEGVYTKELLH